MYRKAAVAFAIWLVPALALAADIGRKDLQVFNDVSKQVLSYPQFTIFDDVSANVHEGVVTLTGKVTMPYKRDDIARRVAQVKGVTKVDDRIGVLPVSQFDDQLRYALARRIYGNFSLSQYATMVNPPIHIVVENGRVTLTGVVMNDVERAVAQSVAMSSPAFSVTDKLLTEAEAKAQRERIG